MYKLECPGCFPADRLEMPIIAHIGNVRVGEFGPSVKISLSFLLHLAADETKRWDELQMSIKVTAQLPSQTLGNPDFLLLGVKYLLGCFLTGIHTSIHRAFL